MPEESTVVAASETQADTASAEAGQEQLASAETKPQTTFAELSRSRAEARANAALRGRALGERLAELRGQDVSAAPETAPQPPPEERAPGEQPSGEDIVRIPIPEGDLRRTLGGAEYVEVPKQLENFVRWNLNNHVRRQQIETYKQRLADAESRELALVERLLRSDAHFAAETRFKQSPEYQAAAGEYQRLAELEQDGQLPEGTARKYWDATVAREFERFQQEEFATRWQGVEDEYAQRVAYDWVADTKARLLSYPEEIRALAGYETWIDEAIRMFDRELEAGNFADIPEGDPEALHQAFEQYFQQRLVLRPEFQALARRWADAKERQTAEAAARQAAEAAARAEREKAEAATRAVQGFKREIIEGRRAVPPHPLGTLPHGAQLPPGQAGEETPLAARSQFELQRKAEQRAAQRAAAYSAKR